MPLSTVNEKINLLFLGREERLLNCKEDWVGGMQLEEEEGNCSCLWVKTTHSIPQSEVFLICILQIIHFCVLQAEDSSWHAAVWLIGLQS